MAISEEHQNAFVTEVERVGRDPVYWVRREASFVVGALAKVVPSEVVTASLVCLFLIFKNFFHLILTNEGSFRYLRHFVGTVPGKYGTPLCLRYPLYCQDSQPMKNAASRSTLSSHFPRMNLLKFAQVYWKP